MNDSPRPRLWTLLVAVLLVAAGYVALEQWILQGYVILSSRQVLAGGELPALARLDRFYHTLPGILLDAVLTEAWIAVVALVAGALSTEPLPRRLGLEPARTRSLAWALVPLGGLALSQAFDALLALSGAGRGAVLDELLGILAQARGGSLVMAVLVIGVLSAMCEELFFRGYLQRRLVARFGPALGIALPALLFALAHFDLRHGGFAFAFGLFVGWAAWKADSTWIAIAAHVTNNTASVLASAFGLDAAPGSRGQVATILGASLAVFAAVVAWYALRSAKITRERPSSAAA